MVDVAGWLVVVLVHRGARGTRAARGAIIVLRVCKGALSLDAAEINS